MLLKILPVEKYPAFLLVGFVLYGSFNKAMQRPEQLFSASIAELQEDLRHLKAEDAAAE